MVVDPVLQSGIAFRVGTGLALQHDRAPERDRMLEEATVLPDGRRVFKSRDGQRVYDEHGQEVPAEVISPAAIDDRKTRSDAFDDVTDRWKHALRDQDGLSAYQAKLDDARERANSGDITDKELAKLKADLKAEMPDALRHKLERDKPETAIDLKQGATAPSMPGNMDTLMSKTGLAPASP